MLDSAFEELNRAGTRSASAGMSTPHHSDWRASYTFRIRGLGEKGRK